MNEIRAPIEGLTDGEASGQGGWRRAPDGIMRGHQGRVGGVVWDKIQEGRIGSAGWDGSVRGWDVETSAGIFLRVRFNYGRIDSYLLTCGVCWVARTHGQICSLY